MINQPSPSQLHTKTAIDSLRKALDDTYRFFGNWLIGDPAYTEDTVAWGVENLYTRLKVVAELLDLPALREDVTAQLAEAHKDGLTTTEQDPGDDPHLKWLSKAGMFVQALEDIYGDTAPLTVSKDVSAILRASVYPITDSALFDVSPQNEAHVHTRIEGILRCVFPDLVHKPRLAKPIKNFEPDTGLPSVSTLIEYKFVSTKAQIPVVADQILADTRGYTAPQWNHFIYVIYETKRLRSESEWNRLLRSCEITSNTIAIVLSGEPPPPKERRKRSTGRRSKTA